MAYTVNDKVLAVRKYLEICTALSTSGNNPDPRLIAMLKNKHQEAMDICSSNELPEWMDIGFDYSYIITIAKNASDNYEGRRVYFREVMDKCEMEMRASEALKPLSLLNAAFSKRYNNKSLKGNSGAPPQSIPPRSLVLTKKTGAGDLQANTSVFLNVNDKAEQKMAKKKVFIVHGHNILLKYEVKALIDKSGYEGIILHDETNGGRTIIQKLTETIGEMDYGVVLYTACDTGSAIGQAEPKPRARQNVVFEHGYLIGKLGPDKVAALVFDGVEKPGDLDGLVYITEDNWKYQLQQELQAKLKD